MYPAALSGEVATRLSQPSHRLAGRHRIRADDLDIERTLACEYGLCRTGRTHGIDLRIRRQEFGDYAATVEPVAQRSGLQSFTGAA
jgi:hypothetical protein